MTVKEFPGDDAFNDSGNFCGRVQRNGLEKEMDMILICSDFDEGDFVVLIDGPADVFQRFLDGLCKDLLPAFDGTDQMVEEKGDIVGFPLMLAHTGSLLQG